MKILLIGGSRDGQRVEAGNAPHPTLRFQKPYPFGVNDPIPPSLTLETENYRLEALHCQIGSSTPQVHWLYVWDRMSVPQMLDALLEGYRRTG